MVLLDLLHTAACILGKKLILGGRIWKLKWLKLIFKTLNFVLSCIVYTVRKVMDIFVNDILCEINLVALYVKIADESISRKIWVVEKFLDFQTVEYFMLKFYVSKVHKNCETIVWTIKCIASCVDPPLRRLYFLYRLFVAWVCDTKFS